MADPGLGPVTSDELHSFFRGELPRLRDRLTQQSLDVRQLKTDVARQDQQLGNIHEFLFGDKELDTPGLNKELAIIKAQLAEIVKQRDLLMAQLAILKWAIPILGGTSIIDIAMRLLGVHT